MRPALLPGPTLPAALLAAVLPLLAVPAVAGAAGGSPAGPGSGGACSTTVGSTPPRHAPLRVSDGARTSTEVVGRDVRRREVRQTKQGRWRAKVSTAARVRVRVDRLVVTTAPTTVAATAVAWCDGSRGAATEVRTADGTSTERERTRRVVRSADARTRTARTRKAALAAARKASTRKAERKAARRVERRAVGTGTTATLALAARSDGVSRARPAAEAAARVAAERAARAALEEPGSTTTTSTTATATAGSATPTTTSAPPTTGAPTPTVTTPPPSTPTVSPTPSPTRTTPSPTPSATKTSSSPTPSPTSTRTTTPTPTPSITTTTPTPTPTTTSTSTPTSTGAPARWQPTLGLTWQWQLSGTVDTNVAADVYDVDSEVSKAVVDALHAKGRKVVCYVSAGSWEPYRADSDVIPEAVRGKTMDGWPDERWLDVRAVSTLRPIMAARFKVCADKGFDAVEPDNVDGYTNDTGFPLTAAHQLAYNKMLAEEAHRLGLAIGLKNDVDQVRALEPFFDFAVNEECAEWDECDLLTPFVQAGKPVFHAEYALTTARFCPTSARLGLSSIRKKLSLNAWRETC